MFYLVASSLILTAAVLIITSAARHAHIVLVALTVNIMTVVVPLLLLLNKHDRKQLDGQKYGLLMAALGGLLVGFYALTYNKALSQTKVGIVTPLVYGGVIFLTTVCSYFMYREKLTAAECMGSALVLAGIVVIVYARATAR